ncbi:unnamed protein product, partial [Hapterophycus canaliculatus]
QAVEAAVETLAAYLFLRSTMGAEEGSELISALAERALCCGRGSVESKADAAAAALLGGGSGDLARRGAWLTLAARAGGLENEYFPPPPSLEGDGGGGARGKSKAAVAAAAPKAVSGCVRAMSAAMQRGGGSSGTVAGGADARKEVYAAAKAMLGSSKLPVKMAGVSLAAALFAAEGSLAKADLGVEDMESRVQAQLERAFADADAAFAAAHEEGGPSAATPPAEPSVAPSSPPIRPQATPRGGGATFGLLDDDGGLELLTPPPSASATASKKPESSAERPVDLGAVGVGGRDRGATAAEAAADASAPGSPFDDLCSEDGGDGSDGDGQEGAAGTFGGGSVAVPTSAVEVDAVVFPEDDAAVTADMPDLRMMTESPSPGNEKRRWRRTAEDGAGGGGASSTGLALGERLAAARGTVQGGAAADAAVTGSPRAFSSRRSGAAARSSIGGYRGSARKTGVRTSVDRETQFLGTQMLVLPDGERSAWDDILADTLLKAPPANPLRWRRHRLSAGGGSPSLRGAGARAPLSSPPRPRAPLDGGRRDEEDARRVMPPPPPPPPPPLVPGHQTEASPFSSRASSPARSLVLPEGLGDAGSVDGNGGPGRRLSSFDVQSNADEPSAGWGQHAGVSDDGSEGQGEPPGSLPGSASSSFRRGEGGRGTAGSESALSWNASLESVALRSSADESVRERMAKFGARQRARQLREQRQTLSHAEDLYAKAGEGGVSTEGAGVGATAESARRLLRGPGSWTSGVGVGGSGPGGVKSPRLMRVGSLGGSNSLGSPSSSSNLVVTQAALGNLTNNLASLMSTNSQVTSENRENRRQSISRRLARGTSLGTGRLLAKEAADLGAVEEAEAVALGASPVAARAAAEAAAAAETLAIRRRVVEARQAKRRSRG